MAKIQKHHKNAKAQRQNPDDLFKIRVVNFTFSSILILGMFSAGKYIEKVPQENLSLDSLKYVSIALLLISYIRFKIGLKFLELKVNELKVNNPTQTLEKTLTLLNIILGVLAMSLLAFLFIYNSEIPSKVSYFFAIQFPQLTAKVIKAISQISTGVFSAIIGALGNILLGVIGNFVYDILKKVLKRKR